MALALIVDSLDAVPEALRAAYVADGDKFKLDAEFEDTTGLKNSVKATRAERDALDKQVKAWGKLGKTPEEIAALVAAADAAEAEALKKAGNFDVILKQHKDAAAKREADLTAERDNALGFGRSAIVETSVMGALTKAKVTSEGVDLLTERLGKRVSLDITGGKRVVTIMQADGTTPMAGSGTDGAATFDDLVKEAIKQYPSLFEGTGAGGGGKPPKDGGGGSGATMTNAEFSALDAKARAAAATKPGFKLVD
jgi:hypothetical protein